MSEQLDSRDWVGVGCQGWVHAEAVAKGGPYVESGALGRLARGADAQGDIMRDSAQVICCTCSGFGVTMRHEGWMGNLFCS